VSTEAGIPVTIAGAGPVGLSLALGLAQHGVRSLVLEQAPALRPFSRALGVLPRTMEIFRDWRVLDDFLAEGTLRTDVSVHVAGRPEPVPVIDLGVLARHTATPGILVLSQMRTEGILLRHVESNEAAEVRFGHRVTGFEQDDSGVTVRVTGDAPYELRCSYLAGCDGAHSTVREQLGWELEGKTYPGRVALVDVLLKGERDLLPWPRVAPGDRVLAALRFEPEHWRIIAPVPPETTDDAVVSPQAIGGMVQALFGPGPSETLWSSVFRLHCRNSPHFRSGRVVIAGDAAHINSPAGGQGMNSGIQDAHNLAWKLARALRRGADAPNLILSYEQERRGAVIRDVEQYTDFLTRSIILARPWLRGAFLGVARAALSVRPVAEQAALRAGMLNTRYSRSALLAGGGTWVGHRAPDGDLLGPDGSRARLLDLAGPEAALILFDDGRLPGWDVPALQAALAHVPELRIAPVFHAGGPAAERYHDADGALWKRWGATPDTAALLRPDGFVGWMARRPSLESLRAGVEQALGVRAQKRHRES
jgi:2-polyprenyl-6-methoxyphenol hydroxylase-like FAD-dependent oxidoreductase